MSQSKFFITLILGVALALVGIPAIFSTPLEATLLNPAAYKDALVQQGVYAKLPTWLAQSAVQGIPLAELDNARLATSTFRPEDFQSLINQVAPQEYLQQQAESLVDQGFAYLDGTADKLALQVDLRPVKTILEGDPSQDIASLVMGTWPPCNAGEVLKLPDLIQQGQVSKLVMCQPPGVWMPVGLSLVKQGVIQYGHDLPDSLSLTQLAPGGILSANDLANLLTLRAAIRLTPFAALLLAVVLGLMALLGSSGGRPPGIPLAIAGLVAIIVAGVGLAAGELWIAGLRPATDAANAGLLNAGLDVAEQVGKSFLLESGLIGLAVLVVGLGLSFVRGHPAVVKTGKQKLKKY
jgi:hypothetical protein